MTDPTDQRLIGIGCSLIGMASVTASDSIMRWLVPVYPVHEILFWRGLVAVPTLLAVMLATQGVASSFARSPGLLALRAMIAIVVTTLLVTSLAVLPYAEAIAVFFVCPIIIFVMSATILHERVSPRLIGALAAGALGMLVMVRPLSGEVSLKILLPLGAGFAYASLQILNRHTRRVHSGLLMALSAHAGLLAFSAVAGAALGSGWLWSPDGTVIDVLLRSWRLPSAGDLALMATAGTATTLGTFLLFQSYRLAPAPIIAPFEYVALPMATLSGFLVWSEVPDMAAVIGMMLIVGGGMWVLLSESASWRHSWKRGAVDGTRTRDPRRDRPVL